jgi:hypothetical protein
MIHSYIIVLEEYYEIATTVEPDYNDNSLYDISPTKSDTLWY